LNGALKMKSRLDELQEYLEGKADPETTQRVLRDLRDPNSGLRRLFEKGRARNIPPLEVLLEKLPEVMRKSSLEEDSYADEEPDFDSLKADPIHRRWKLRTRFAIAAILLLGVGLFIGINIPEGRQELRTEVSPRYVASRGQEKDLRVEIRSPLAGFASVIAISPEGRPEVFPALGGEEIPIAAATPRDFGPLPEKTAAAVVVVTETPAADVLRKSLRGKTFAPNDMKPAEEFVRSALKQHNYRRIAVGECLVSPPTK